MYFYYLVSFLLGRARDQPFCLGHRASEVFPATAVPKGDQDIVGALGRCEDVREGEGEQRFSFLGSQYGESITENVHLLSLTWLPLPVGLDTKGETLLSKIVVVCLAAGAPVFIFFVYLESRDCDSIPFCPTPILLRLSNSGKIGAPYNRPSYKKIE